MRVPKRRRDVQDRLRREIQRHLLRGQHLLQIRQSAAEEGGVFRTDQHRRIAQLASAGVQRQNDQLLLLQPGERLASQRLEGLSKTIRRLRFVGRLVIRHDQAIRFPAAHVSFRVIHGKPVLAPRYRRLDHSPAIRHFVADLEYIGRLIAAHRQVEQRTAVPGNNVPATMGQQVLDLFRKGHVLKVTFQHRISPRFDESQ